jgi:MFS transporter, SP family, sugar:H+ symporter
MIYETKGLSLEQVDELYDVVHNARKSTKFVPQVSFQQMEAEGAAARGMSISEAHQRKESVGEQQEKA